MQYSGYKRGSYCFCKLVVLIAGINIEKLTITRISASRRSQVSFTLCYNYSEECSSDDFMCFLCIAKSNFR